MKYANRFLIFCLFAFSFWIVLPEASSRPQRVRLTTLAPKDSSFDKLLKRMGAEWKKETNGQVSLIVFAGGSQGGESAMVDRMRVNQTQAALISGIGLSEVDPAVAGLQKIPLLFRSLDELDYVMGKLAPDLEKRVEEKGFIILSWMDSGWVRLFSKELLETPDDMRKFKLFTQTGDPEQTELLKKLGFRPIPIESTDILPSLQTGLIDAVPLPPFFALATQSYKSAPYMLDLNYVPVVGAIVLTKKVWDRIAPEHQVIVKEIAQRIGREMTESGRKENEESIRVMSEQWGLKIRDFDSDLQNSWDAVVQDAYSFIRDSTVPADIFDRVLMHTEEYRSAN